MLDDGTRKMLQKITDTFILEQRHAERSAYYFNRRNVSETDTMPRGGKGNPVGYTGMTWSGFRPSDDSCVYNYLIPANLMCAAAMDMAASLFEAGWNDAVYKEKCLRLAREVRAGVEAFGIVEDTEFGRIYAYETDGLGRHLLMDDANSPSLLALPYLGCCKSDDPVYRNTRAFLLSKRNPWYFEGKAAKGIGSPHTGKDKIWPISLVMQILTSSDEAERLSCLQMLANTHAGTNFMHESFDKDDPSRFTRSWFAWANALFAQMLGTL